MDQARKVAIITGASGGIGLQLVKDFLIENYIVCAFARSNIDDLEKLKSESEHIDNLKIFKFDLNSSEDLKITIKNIWKEFSRIDVLVNSAGEPHGSLFSMTRIEDLEKIFKINLFSAIIISQLCARLMQRRNSGVICNISSVSSYRGDAGTLVYGASKAALNFATKVMANELGKCNIRVNGIAPGVTNTKMLSKMDKNAINLQIEQSALGKIANVKNISDAVKFLCSQNASHITGQIIRVDGGQFC